MDDSHTPTFAELAADPEIAALLDFEPAPVKPRVNGWDPDSQRAFVAMLAVTGSKGRAAEAINRNDGGLDRIFARANGAAFKAAADAAIELFRRKHSAWLGEVVALSSPAFAGEGDRAEQGGGGAVVAGVGPPGQRLNERGEWEDHDSYDRRTEAAHENMRIKLLGARRLYLQQISSSPGKRAAFEILAEYEVDWDKAADLAQDDEPWRRGNNQREPDMVLIADSGWSFGEIGYGEDKLVQLYEAVNEHRAADGLGPIEWCESGERPRSSLSRSAWEGSDKAEESNDN
jgi:hypothetical protein